MKWFTLSLLLLVQAAPVTGAITNRFTIDSDVQYLLENGDMKATGHVHIVSGDMVIDADETVYYRENPADSYVTAVGSPVRYRGTLDNGRPFTGHALHLRYVPTTGVAVLTGNVFIQQGHNTINAEKAIHNTRTQETTASSIKGKRVRTVIDDHQSTTKKK